MLKTVGFITKLEYLDMLPFQTQMVDLEKIIMFRNLTIDMMAQEREENKEPILTHISKITLDKTNSLITNFQYGNGQEVLYLKDNILFQFHFCYH